MPESDLVRSPHDHFEDQTQAELRESAYRRGYTHGFNDLRLMLPIEDREIKKHLDELMSWRFRLGKYERPRSDVEPPPTSAIADEKFWDSLGGN